MNYKQAVDKIRLNRCIGLLLIVLGVAVTLVSFLKYLYAQAVNIEGNDLLGGLGVIIKNIILTIYNLPYMPKSLWLLSPELDTNHVLFSGNISFFLFYIMMFVGVSFWSSASVLSSRLKNIKIMIENERLAASMRGEPTLTVEKMIENVTVKKESIYSKLHQLYLAPLIVTVLGALIACLLKLN